MKRGKDGRVRLDMGPLVPATQKLFRAADLTLNQDDGATRGCVERSSNNSCSAWGPWDFVLFWCLDFLEEYWKVCSC